MIAILGATGYIGRSLARRVACHDERDLMLFARSPERLRDEPWPSQVRLADLAEFDASAFALVINALGAGDPGRVAALGPEVFTVTREWDERVLATLAASGRYVFLSSGAIYGESLSAAHEGSVLPVPVNRLDQFTPYVAAKLSCELRHRFAPQQAILDLRVFAYAEANLSLSGSFFLSELAASVASGAPFVTSREDMIRDYSGAEELWAFVKAWESAGAPNRALDLYTRAPVGKHTLLKAAGDRYGIEVRYAEPGDFAAPTGVKPVYASEFKSGGGLGYAPRRDALGVVLDALDAFRPLGDE